MINIYNGDAREVLKTLAAQSTHCCISSPPYYGLRDYGVIGQIGLESTLPDFYQAIVDVYKEVWRVMRDDATCWINVGDTYRDGELLGVPWDMINAIRRTIRGCPKCGSAQTEILHGDGHLVPWKMECQDCGHAAAENRFKRFILRMDCIWHKSNPVPEPERKRPTLAHEYMFMLVKSRDYYYDSYAIRERTGDEPSWDEYLQARGEGATSLGHYHDKVRGLEPRLSRDKELSHPHGRNKHSVWKVPTRGFADAHFATFPPALIEPCILAGSSDHGSCSKCGAPYQRIVEPSPEYAKRLGESWHDHQDDLNRGQRGTPAAFRGGPALLSKGWKPGCECNAEVRPCVILDPFNGAGTTGLVAARYFRDYIGIELNPEYAEMARERIAGDQPLFNQVAVNL